MRKYLYTLVLILWSIGLFAQPGIDWTKTDLWADVNPVDGSPVAAKYSGEDWFYSAFVTKDNTTQQPNGYVYGGYTTVPTLDYTQYTNYWNAGGCGAPYFHESCEDLRLADPAVTTVSGYTYRTITGGFTMPSLAIGDLSGNISDYHNVLPYVGLFYDIIQTSDGGYIAAGNAQSYSKLNFTSGSISGIDPIPYRYEVGSPQNANYYSLDQSNYLNCGALVQGSLLKPFVVKLNSDLTVAWHTIYGLYSPTGSPSAFQNGGEIFSIVECKGGYILAARHNSDGWVAKIDYDGLLQWRQSIGAEVRDVVRSIEGSSEYYYITGEYNSTLAFAAKLDESGNFDSHWTSGTDPHAVVYDPSTGEDLGYSIDRATNGDIFIGGLGSISGLTGNGFIYRLSSYDGSVIYYVNDATVSLAEDLWYVVTATADGGCAAVSTTQVHPLQCSISGLTLPQGYPGYSPSSSDTCTNSTASIWNTDAYIARFDNTLTKLWSTVFDAGTTTPSGSILDILAPCDGSSCSTCPLTSSSWQIPNQDGKDVKRQECMFGIAEAPDGGILAVGKDSRNLDDSYAVKLACEASLTSLLLQSQTLTGVHEYKNSTITTNTNLIVSNATGTTVEMKACDEIVFDVETDVLAGSYLLAQVSPQYCCTPGGGSGARIAQSMVASSPATNENSNTNNAINVNIYPNPTTGLFTVSLKVQTAMDVKIEVSTMLGDILSAGGNFIHVDSGEERKVDVDLRTNKKGMYLVKIIFSDNSVVRQVLVE